MYLKTQKRIKREHKNRRKPKNKMRYQEDNFQMNVARFLDYSGYLWNHAANERRTSQQAGVRLKKKGVKAGFPDVAIFEPRGRYHGLFIELKVATEQGYKNDGTPKAKKKNYPSEEQKEWLRALEGRGYKTALAYTMDEVIHIVTEYMKEGG